MLSRSLDAELHEEVRADVRLPLLAAFLACCLTLAGCAPAQRTEQVNQTPPLQYQPASFDYYVLALSWAPAFCAHSERSRTSRECDPDRQTGFIVHGLWPEDEVGRAAEDCGSARPVSHEIVDGMLSVMPDRGLVQHEWRTHGTCTGLPPAQYFNLVRTAYAAVRIPEKFMAPHRELRGNPQVLERSIAERSGFASANSVRVACREGELTEVRVCFTKQLQSRPCSESVRDCRSERIFVRPVI